MRVALIVAGGVDRTGRERVLPELLDFIARIARRHELHVFALQYYRDACEYPLLGATVHDLGRVDRPRGLRRWRMQRRLHRALARVGRFDVLHAYWGMPTGAVTVNVARAAGTPAIVTLTTGELVGMDDIRYGLQRRGRDRRAIDRIFQRAALVTVPTGYMQQLAHGTSGDVTVVPMGLDPGRFSSTPVPDGPPWRLIRVGTINAVKDYPLLLRAFAAVLRIEPDTWLDVVGEDVLAGRMHALARHLGVAARVIFHGYQPMDALPALYGRAHLHVVTSRHEASSVAALEASLSSVATVGTPVGHLADWAALDPPAALTGAADPAALADAVIALLRDPPRRRRLAAAGRAWALAHDADWTASAFDQIYAHVAAAAR